jgi:lipopolysaccharide assembly outer membrane protein LptD (OstA)
MNPKILNIGTGTFIILKLWILSLILCSGTKTQAQNNDSIIAGKQEILRDTIRIQKRKPEDSSRISKSAIQSVINYSAKDSIPIDFENNMISLYGNALVQYDEIELRAGIIFIQWEKDLIYAEGYYDSLDNYLEAPVFIDKGQEYKAKKIIYNFKTKKGKLFTLFTHEGESYIHGEEVKKDEEDVFYIKNARFTTCDHEENPHFYIAATRIKVIPNKHIISGPAYMVIEDIPVPLGIPFGFFPSQDKRSSGIVIPTYGESLSRGFFLKQGGYYLGLNDYFDLLLKGDIYTGGSWLLNASSNYKKRYRYNGNFFVQYAHNAFGDPESPDYYLSKDFSVRWTHRQDNKARPNSNFSANVNAGSQNAFRNNFNNPVDIFSNNLNSSISYSKTFSGTPFSLTSSLTHNQNLSKRTLDLTTPQLALNMKKIFLIPRKAGIKKKWYHNINVSYRMDFRNSISTYDSLFLEPETWKEWQNGFKHYIPLATSMKIFKYFTFTPSINYTGRTYFERNKKEYRYSTNPEYSDSIVDIKEKGMYHLHEFSSGASVSTRVYGMFNINTLGIIAVRHLITPSISLSYKPDFAGPEYGYYASVRLDSAGNTQEYSYYSQNIYGTPGRGEQALLSFQLQNNLEAKVKSKNDTVSQTKKIKILDVFNFNGSYNFLADSMKLSRINFNGRTALFNNKLSLQFSGSIDPYFITKDSFLVDKFSIAENGKIGRITQAMISLSTSLNSKKQKNTKQEILPPYMFHPFNYYIDFDVPWNVNLSYSLNYSNYSPRNRKYYDDPFITQSISFGGNVNLTDKWKIGFRSGYDIKNKDFTYTSVDIYRDLHCWEMRFNWIPFGFLQSYMFGINVKSTLLQDLKFDKKKYYYDY